MERTTWDYKHKIGLKLFVYWLARRLRWAKTEQVVGEKLYYWMSAYKKR